MILRPDRHHRDDDATLWLAQTDDQGYDVVKGLLAVFDAAGVAHE